MKLFYNENFELFKEEEVGAYQGSSNYNELWVCLIKTKYDEYITAGKTLFPTYSAKLPNGMKTIEFNSWTLPCETKTIDNVAYYCWCTKLVDRVLSKAGDVQLSISFYLKDVAVSTKHYTRISTGLTYLHVDEAVVVNTNCLFVDTSSAQQTMIDFNDELKQLATNLSQKADATVTTSALNGKASKNGSSEEDFNAKNLKVKDIKLETLSFDNSTDEIIIKNKAGYTMGKLYGNGQVELYYLRLGNILIDEARLFNIGDVFKVKKINDSMYANINYLTVDEGIDTTDITADSIDVDDVYATSVKTTNAEATTLKVNKIETTNPYVLSTYDSPLSFLNVTDLFAYTLHADVLYSKTGSSIKLLNDLEPSGNMDLGSETKKFNKIHVKELSDSIIKTVTTSPYSIVNKQYVDSLISNLIGTGTPQAFDTLKEIADWLQTHDGKYTTLVADVNGKANKSTTLDGYGITDAYKKSEVYTKEEVSAMFVGDTTSLFSELEEVWA